MDIAEPTYPNKRAASPMPTFDIARSLAIEGQDFLQLGFSLAYFIFPDRTAALRMLTNALNKLKSKTGQERKRAYWRDKFLKSRITRITRDEEDTLQWLIYFESDLHEAAQEVLGRSSIEDMVVRYIKTLIQLSTGMSSFYVNIAIHRLLYSYTTLETQQLYDFITDHYRGADEYRRAKGLLMTRLESRFGTRIRTTKTDRGETRYEPAENQGMWRELVLQCLQMFTPWSTQSECPFNRQADIPPNRLNEAIIANCEKGSNQDKIEINRCHVFIDPVCCGYLIQELGLEDHPSKLNVPRFYMDADRNSSPPSSTLRDTPLTSQERTTIAEVLSAEAARRRNIVPGELKFFVDGIEHACLNLEKSRELSFPASAEARLLEVRTQDEAGPVLLATHIIAPVGTPHAENDFALALKGGKSLTVALKNTAGTTNPLKIFVLVEDADHTPMALRVRNWLGCAPAFPALASIAALFIAILLLSADLWRTVKREQSLNSALRTELARDRASQPSFHSAEVRTLAKYRLTPDDLVTRGNGDIHRQPVAVSSIPNVIELVLPVTDIHSRYRFVLTTFDADKRILVEEALSADIHGAEATITCPVPSNLLLSDQYYRVELLDMASHHVRTFTFYTSPMQH